MIDLSSTLPAGGRLDPGAKTSGKTISISSDDQRKIEFAFGVIGQTAANQAPQFNSEPVLAGTIGEAYIYEANAIDPDGQTPVYYLADGPAEMVVDPATGLLSWIPEANANEFESVTLLAFDSRGAIALQRFSIQVDGGNHAPEFVGLPTNIVITEGETIEMVVCAADKDFDPLTLWAANLPPGASFDASTRLFSWTPNFEAAGHYDIRFSAKDSDVITTTTMGLSVQEGVEPIEVLLAGELTVREGESLRSMIRATGGLGELKFHSSLLPFGATLDPALGVFDWTPSYSQHGKYVVPFSVTAGEQTEQVQMSIEVLNANGDPSFDPVDGWVVFEGQPVSFTASAFDPDNPLYDLPLRDKDGNLIEFSPTAQTVSVQATELPAGATFDEDTWQFWWLPGYEDAGSYSATFSATDNGDGVRDPVTIEMTVPIEVLNLNRRPQLSTIENVSLSRDEVVDVTVTATDADGNPIVLDATSESIGFPLPDFMSFIDNGDGSGTLHIAPGFGDRGDHAITVLAADNGDDNPEKPLADAFTFVVSVESDNEPPQLSFIGDSVAVIGEELLLPVSVRDMDQDALNFQLAGLPTGAAIQTTGVYGEAFLKWTPDAADTGSYLANLTVEDSGNGIGPSLSDSLTFAIEVRGDNQEPSLSPVGALRVTEGSDLSFKVSGADPDNDTLTYQASGLPEGAELNPQTGLLRFTPRSNQAGNYPVVFTVTDGNRTDTENVSLTVQNLNAPPRFVPLADQLARENTELRFKVVAADSDGESVLYSVAQGLPDGAIFVERTGEFIWRPTFEQSGNYPLTFAAQDAEGETAFLDVNIRVANINRLPALNESNHLFLLGEEKSFTLKASDPDNTPLSFSAENLPEDATLEASTGRFTWRPGPGQAGEYLVTFIADDGQIAARQTVVLLASLEPIPPTVRVEQTPSFPTTPGKEVTVSVQASGAVGGGNDIRDISLTLHGDPVPISHVAPGLARARLVVDQPGKLELIATVTDADGEVSQVRSFLRVRDPRDLQPPLVSLAAGLQGAMLTVPQTIIGLVDDVNLDNWSLQLVDGNGQAHQLGHGESMPGQSPDGVGEEAELALLDPQRYANGFYTLRLTATDISGRTSSVEQQLELSTQEKLGRYSRNDQDSTVDFGGFSFDLIRRFDSLTSGDGNFGTTWSFLGRDATIQTNVESPRAQLGVLSPFGLDTRLYLNLPTGQRVAFQFTPVTEAAGGLTFYRPQWTAIPSGGASTVEHGFRLDSNNQLLSRAGANFYHAATGRPYNPLAYELNKHAFTLTGADGTIYGITEGSVSEIVFPSGDRLFLSDSAIIHEPSGRSVQIVRDGVGRMVRVQTPDNAVLIYQYDDDGRLVSVRNLSTSEGYRYGYVEGNLTTAVTTSSSGVAVRYDEAGQPIEKPVKADLGGLAAIQGQAIAGTLAAQQVDRYVFAVRKSEIQSVAGEQLILRVEVDGLSGFATTSPVIDGATLVSTQMNADQSKLVALFAVREAGQYLLSITSASVGDYSLSLGVAGDLNSDGLTDGLDTQIFDASTISDIDGDGEETRIDRQVLYANFGFTENGAPVVADALPIVMTHVDLSVGVDLATIASDPNGDRVFYRVVDSTGGIASVSADGRTVQFSPQASFAGPASFSLIADDGFNQSEAATLDVTISSLRS